MNGEKSLKNTSVRLFIYETKQIEYPMACRKLEILTRISLRFATNESISRSPKKPSHSCGRVTVRWRVTSVKWKLTNNHLLVACSVVHNQQFHPDLYHPYGIRPRENVGKSSRNQQFDKANHRSGLRSKTTVSAERWDRFLRENSIDREK